MRPGRRIWVSGRVDIFLGYLNLKTHHHLGLGTRSQAHPRTRPLLGCRRMARNVLNKGWRYHLQGGTFRSILKFEDFQAKASASDVVLRMEAAPVTQLDLDHVRGLYGPITAPCVAGVTGAGIVTKAAGAFKEGDHAVLATGSGSWAAYAVADASKLVKVPSTMPME